MQHGAVLLQTTDVRVSDVARRVGHRQSAQFARAFRRHHGVSPMYLRRVAGRPTDAASSRRPAAALHERLEPAQGLKVCAAACGGASSAGM
jgi:AraC-like DNA-binding protein